MPRLKKLVGDLCCLSPIRDEDSAKYAEWLNDPEVSISRGDAHLIGSVSRMKQEIDAKQQSDVHIYTILSADTDEAIGWISLDDLDRHNSRATLDYVTAREARLIKGVEHEAIALLTDYGFNILNLNSILAIVPSCNSHSVDVFKDVGFTEIGRLRQARLIAGQYYDEIWLDLLQDEFESDHIRSFVK